MALLEHLLFKNTSKNPYFINAENLIFVIIWPFQAQMEESKDTGMLRDTSEQLPVNTT